MYGLYDRQIRLFGRDTQQRIESASACIIQRPPYFLNRKERRTDIGGEILKSLALLGVRTLSASASVEESFKRISPNDVCRINKDAVLNAGTQSTHTLAVFIDEMGQSSAETTVYVCSRCMSFNNARNEHVCTGYVFGECVFAEDCLLGAVVVQEWVKKLQGKPHVEEYQLKI